jgi:hypothetical protein
LVKNHASQAKTSLLFAAFRTRCLRELAGQSGKSASQLVSGSASQPKGPKAGLWSLLFGQKTDFPGDFQGSNLTIRENFGFAPF